ncbi:twin-arginine translocation signal domain-containing protein [Selenomonas ruminis]|uniref:Twin-arginine translocation signal domain-containing protein n=1 Tax=Selenomonas ruminis TaxID=2593411 RepID=A0A5D6WCB4_9FIRM|nr:twin-arginine translocation signal domain-containing protein [Selenomonas sp. mPRGC5]TYZ25122.1 twin-arginine translocation signal domain-containing protein [Selenomonas sp. mPRGC5]
MKNEPKNKNLLSRRRFLKGIAAGGCCWPAVLTLPRDLSTGRPSPAYGL